jgi:hypothetical protein
MSHRGCDIRESHRIGPYQSATITVGISDDERNPQLFVVDGIAVSYPSMLVKFFTVVRRVDDCRCGPEVLSLEGIDDPLELTIGLMDAAVVIDRDVRVNRRTLANSDGDGGSSTYGACGSTTCT